MKCKPHKRIYIAIQSLAIFTGVVALVFSNGASILLYNVGLDELAEKVEISEAHASGGIDVEKGSFTRDTDGTGNQTVTLSDSSLTPKAIIFFGTNQTATGTLAADQSFWGYMVNGTQQRAYASAQVNENKNHKGRANTNAIIIIDTAGGIDAVADFVSFSAGQFIIDWTTNDNVANIIHYIALGGNTLTDVEVGDFTLNTSTGNQEIDFASAFAPKLVLFMGSRALISYPTNSTQDSFFWGMAASSTARGGMAADMKADKTFTTQRTDRIISIFDGGNAIEGDVEFVSMDADGFTINVTDAPPEADRVAYLALGGVNLDVDVGSFDQPTSTGVQTITTTHEPKVVYLQSWGKASTTTPTNLTETSWGAAASTTQEGSIFLSMNDLKDNSRAGVVGGRLWMPPRVQ